MDNKSDMSKEQEVRLDAEISSYNNDSTQESAAIGGNKSCEWYEKKVKEAAEAGLERIENSDEDKDMDKVCRKPSLIELENELLKNAIFIVRNGSVYYYDEGAHYYKLVDEDDVIEIFRSSVDPELYNTNSLRIYNELYRFIKTDPFLKCEEELDQKTYCTLKNGIYFTKKKKLKNHSARYIRFTCLDAYYDGSAMCPVFNEFIDKITGGRKDLRKRLLMALGYLLVDTKRGKFFFLAGFMPNTGKSVLFNFIQKLYPQEAVSNLPVGDLGGRFESETLLHSRINISLDLPQEPLNASTVAKLKQITGGDTVEVQRKNKTSRRLDHPVKLVFASNSPIRLKKDDKAFWNRLIFLPFQNPVAKEEQDLELDNKLWAERDGIVTLLLKYARKLEKLNFQFPPIPEDTIKELKQPLPVDYVQDFLDDCCEVGNYSEFSSTAEIRKAYIVYCEENLLPPCSPTQFNSFLEGHGIYRDRKYVDDVLTRGFLGIKLKDEFIINHTLGN